MTKATLRASLRDLRRKLTPQADRIVRHMLDAGSITQREALVDYSVQSLTRRITEIRDAGIGVIGISKKHPTTGQRYTRYKLEQKDLSN